MLEGAIRERQINSLLSVHRRADDGAALACPGSRFSKNAACIPAKPFSGGNQAQWAKVMFRRKLVLTLAPLFPVAAPAKSNGAR